MVLMIISFDIIKSNFFNLNIQNLFSDTEVINFNIQVLNKNQFKLLFFS